MCHCHCQVFFWENLGCKYQAFILRDEVKVILPEQDTAFIESNAMNAVQGVEILISFGVYVHNMPALLNVLSAVGRHTQMNISAQNVYQFPNRLCCQFLQLSSQIAQLSDPDIKPLVTVLSHGSKSIPAKAKSVNKSGLLLSLRATGRRSKLPFEGSSVRKLAAFSLRATCLVGCSLLSGMSILMSIAQSYKER